MNRPSVSVKNLVRREGGARVLIFSQMAVLLEHIRDASSAVLFSHTLDNRARRNIP